MMRMAVIIRPFLPITLPISSFATRSSMTMEFSPQRRSSHLIWLVHNRFGNVRSIDHRLCVTSLCYSSWLIAL
jgi:hypothetical protein